jgi:hypothetical protein
MQSDAELIKRVEEIWAKNPYATRNVFKKNTGASVPRLEKLAKAGLIKFPNPVPKNMCHVFSDQTKWRKFRLKGSPTRSKT